MSPLTSQQLPGFDPQQTYTIRTVITAAVAEGVEKGIAAYQKDHCEEHQRHTEELRHTVYGHCEVPGLDERVRMLEAFENRINRVTWIAVAAFITSLAGVILTILPHIIKGTP